MKRIRRQFGVWFATALSRCPTLVQDLKEIRAAGVNIVTHRRGKATRQAFSMLSTMTIHIGWRSSRMYKLLSLAHEKVHMIDSPVADPIAGKTGRQEFIEMCLEAETDAFCHEVKVIRELRRAGYKVDPELQAWYWCFRRGGRAAVRKAVEKAPSCNTGEAYPEYYGHWYDETIAEGLRMPVASQGKPRRLKSPGYR